MDKDTEPMDQKDKNLDTQGNAAPETIPTATPDPESENDGGQPAGVPTPEPEPLKNESTPSSDDRLELGPTTPDPKKNSRADAPADSAPPTDPETSHPAGPLARIFDALSHAGLLVLLVLCVLMTCAEVLQIRDLWFSDEVHIADVFQRLRHGDWLVLTMNGVPYPDKPPLYFWAMQALSLLPGVSVPMAMFLAVAISHALFTGSVWALARGTGHDRRVALAAGFLTLCCIYVSGTACYLRMDLLFSSLIILAMTCLYRGWIKSCAPFWLGAGFLLLGLSTLVKGPLGIGFALITSILFLFWRGTPGRLNGRDGLPGFLLMLVLILVWIGAVYLKGDSNYLYEMIGVQLTGRIMGESAPHTQPWWYYLAALPLMWLPWILIVLFVNWLAAMRGIPAAWKSRKTDGGSCWLWIWLVSGVAILSAVSSKIAVYALPLLAPLAVLTARSLLKLTPGRSRWFFRLTSLILFLAGLALVLVDVFPLVRAYIPNGWLPPFPPVVDAWLEALHGTAIMGSILILLALVLIAAVCLAQPGGALLVTTIGMVAMVVPYELVVAPSLNAILSPRSQAEAMLEKVKDGYAPAAFKVYRGAYAWHLNQLAGFPDTLLNVPDLKDTAALNAWLAQNPKAVIAMPEKEWDAWTDKPSTASVLLHSWMVDQPYVVTAMDVTPPAPHPEANSEELTLLPETGAQVPAETSPIPESEAGTSASPDADPVPDTVQETPVAEPVPAPVETPAPSEAAK